MAFLNDEIIKIAKGLEANFDGSECEEMDGCETAADLPGTVLGNFVDDVESLLQANAISTYSVNYLGKSDVADGMGVEAYFDVVWCGLGGLENCPVRICSAY